MGLFNIFKRLDKKGKKDKEYELPEKYMRWNRFAAEVCFRDMETLSQIQKNAVLCFWYDAEMQNGGHCGYFDCYSETVPQELIDAIIEVSYKEIADNYKKAIEEGEKDDWQQTDFAYYDFSPSLIDCLQEYVEKHKEVIFD